MSWTRPRSSRPTAGVVVLVDPFLNERAPSYGSMVALAVRLARAGWQVVRYDARGSGESHGSAEQSSWTDHDGDLDAVVQWAREMGGTAEVTLIGLRLGGTLAMLRSRADRSIRRVVAMDPVVKGASWVRIQVQEASIWRESGAASRQERSVVDLNGLPTSRRFLNDVEIVDLSSFEGPPGVEYVLVNLSRLAVFRNQLDQLHERLAKYARSRFVDAPGPPFWNRTARNIDPQAVGRIVAELRS